MDIRCPFQVELSQFDSICRFCMKTDLFLKPLFYDEDNTETDDFASDNGNSNETVAEMVAFCMQLKISSEDGLPKFMCSACCDELVRCNNFRRKCLQSDEILKETLRAGPTAKDSYDGENETDKYFSYEDMYDSDVIYNLKEQERTEISIKSDRLFLGCPTRISQVKLISTDQCMKSKHGKDDISESFENNPSSTGKDLHFKIEKPLRNRHTRSSFRTNSYSPETLRLFRCTDCCKRFKARKYLACHRKVHIRQGNAYKCRKCDIIFLLPGLYRRHMQSHKELIRKRIR